MIRVERKIHRFRSGRSSSAPDPVTGTVTNIIPYGLLAQARCINGENAELAVRSQHSELGSSIRLHVRKRQLQSRPWSSAASSLPHI